MTFMFAKTNSNSVINGEHRADRMDWSGDKTHGCKCCGRTYTAAQVDGVKALCPHCGSKAWATNPSTDREWTVGDVRVRRVSAKGEPRWDVFRSPYWTTLIYGHDYGVPLNERQASMSAHVQASEAAAFDALWADAKAWIEGA
jgi:predicted  nucleic acid-binding Zn-ribbon protein